MCVFKNHAFIYFLRPPSWSGTPMKHNCHSSFYNTVICSHFKIICGHFIIVCGHFFNIIWCHFCFHFLDKISSSLNDSSSSEIPDFLQIIGQGVRSSSGQIDSCWGLNLNQVSWLPKIHVSSPSGNMIYHWESPTTVCAGMGPAGDLFWPWELTSRLEICTILTPFLHFLAERGDSLTSCAPPAPTSKFRSGWFHGLSL